VNTQSVDVIMREVEAERHKNFLGKQQIWHVDQQSEQRSSPAHWLVSYWRGAPIIDNPNLKYTPNFNMQRSPV
jgi:hypothetical protein